jgi:hypothetical protein
MGAPRGNGVRVGIDFDRDGIQNLAPAELDPWDPDVNADGKPDGYNPADTTPPGVVEESLDFVTSRIAKYHIRFTEDVRYRVEYIAPGMVRPLVFHSVRGNQAAGLHDYADVDTFVLTHSNPSGAGLNPPGTSGNDVTFSVTVFPEDRNGNKVTNGLGQEVGIPLMPFTPLEGDDQDGVDFIDFSHVDSIVETAVPPGTIVPSGFEARAVRIALRENETFFGSSIFVPMMNASAFVTLGLENLSPLPGEPDFELVDVTGSDFQTTHPTTFSTVPGGGPYTGLSNYVVSPLTTDGSGNTTMVFFFRNLQPGQDIKVAVQGILRASNPGGPPPILYTDVSLGEMQMLKLEDAMEVRIERP